MDQNNRVIVKDNLDKFFNVGDIISWGNDPNKYLVEAVSKDRMECKPLFHVKQMENL